MKKYLLLFLSLLTVATASATEVSFFANNSDNVTIYYAINDDGVSVVRLNDGGDYSGYVKIPETATHPNGTTYTVNKIDGAFYECPKLTKVLIPNTVKEITAYSFYNCKGLTNINFPDSITDIGSMAFYNCNSMPYLHLPPYLTHLGCDAFQNKVYYDSQYYENYGVYCGEYLLKGLGYQEKKVVVKEGTRLIADSAYVFKDITFETQMEEYAMPITLKHIGAGAFEKSVKLKAITFPERLESIGKRAFADCSNLDWIKISHSVRFIDNHAFKNCKKIATVIVDQEKPELIEVVDNPFEGSILSNATLYVPQGCRYSFALRKPWNKFGVMLQIEMNYDFGKNDIYYKFTADGLGVNVVYRTYSYGNSYKGHVIIPANVISPIDYKTYPVVGIDNHAFTFCDELEAVTIPWTVTNVDEYAFWECTSLKDIYMLHNQLGDELSVSVRAFIKTAVDKGTLYVPYGKKSLYDSSKFYSTTFGSIEEMPYMIAQTEEDGSTIYYNLNSDYTEAYVAPGPESQNSYTGDVAIPKKVTCQMATFNVTGISDKAFAQCPGVTSVKIPNSVKTIGKETFLNCSGLTTLTLPNSVQSIGSEAFAGCGLVSLIVPKSVTEISDNVFENCKSLSSLTFQNFTGYSIGNEAFKNCSKLKTMTLWISDPYKITLGEKALSSYDMSDATLYVPTGCTVAYRNAPQWSGFFNIKEKGSDGVYDFEAPNSDGMPIYYRYNDGVNGSSVSVTYKSKDAASYKGDVVIPETVKFNNREYIVTAIGDYSFSTNYKNSVTSVTIPNTVVEIGERALANNDLKSVSIGNSVRTIGDYAFSGCLWLTEAVLPESLVEIGNGAFRRCEYLDYIVIPDGVTTIGDEAFYQCWSAQELTIGQSVSYIGKNAFTGSVDVKTVYIRVTDPAYIELGEGVFLSFKTDEGTLWVPRGSKSLYKKADQWSALKRIKEYGDLGDVNQDGYINERDIEGIYNHIYENLSYTYFDEVEADVNCDGKIDALDISAIIDYMNAE